MRDVREHKLSVTEFLSLSILVENDLCGSMRELQNRGTGQCNVDGNEISKELARQGSTMDICDVGMSIRPPISHFYFIQNTK